MEKAKTAKVLFDSGTRTVEEIAGILGIGRATCYRYIDCANERSS
ncbi:helix-turn-helix domain-containing protein [Pontibacter silvestris]|nr:helix-turn-helix domain-containing protein [Pontibacter silvestris]MCC9139006.1 helix-turn-helix domain-containing protein [Pontibacter silvestris]